MSSSWVTEPAKSTASSSPSSSANRSSAVRYSSLIAPSHEAQPGLGIVEPSVRGQRLDQVVLTLVGGDLSDEEEVGPPAGPLDGQTLGQLRVR